MRYRIEFTYTSSDFVEVEADNEDEAGDVALQEIWEDDVEILDVYEI